MVRDLRVALLGLLLQSAGPGAAHCDSDDATQTAARLDLARWSAAIECLGFSLLEESSSVRRGETRPAGTIDFLMGVESVVQ